MAIISWTRPEYYLQILRRLSKRIPNAFSSDFSLENSEDRFLFDSVMNLLYELAWGFDKADFMDCPLNSLLFELSYDMLLLLIDASDTITFYTLTLFEDFIDGTLEDIR